MKNHFGLVAAGGIFAFASLVTLVVKSYLISSFTPEPGSNMTAYEAYDFMNGIVFMLTACAMIMIVADISLRLVASTSMRR